MKETTKGEQTRKKILKRARKALIVRGFYNTSINDIISATGVKKGNLYYHFASKEELGIAVLQDAKDEFFQILTAAFVGRSPLERVENFLDVILNEQRDRNFVGGCLFGNTALEMSDNNSKFAKIINELFISWADIIEGHLKEAVANGEFISPFTPWQLATLIIASIEGGIMMSRVSKEEECLLTCIKSLKILLKSKS